MTARQLHLASWVILGYSNFWCTIWRWNRLQGLAVLFYLRNRSRSYYNFSLFTTSPPHALTRRLGPSYISPLRLQWSKHRICAFWTHLLTKSSLLLSNIKNWGIILSVKCLFYLALIFPSWTLELWKNSAWNCFSIHTEPLGAIEIWRTQQYRRVRARSGRRKSRRVPSSRFHGCPGWQLSKCSETAISQDFYA